ncbi:MAG: hypothetical protein HQK53_03055 [Oligoflexia bacterium]|nr:hypothetical protein [Oligoflexia bacterium]
MRNGHSITDCADAGGIVTKGPFSSNLLYCDLRIPSVDIHAERGNACPAGWGTHSWWASSQGPIYYLCY